MIRKNRYQLALKVKMRLGIEQKIRLKASKA